MSMPDSATTMRDPAIESPYAWTRLVVAVLLMGLGGCGMYSVTVVLPLIQQEFGVSRSDASLPYTALMVGFTIGGIFMGRLSDRFGVMPPVIGGALVPWGRAPRGGLRTEPAAVHPGARPADRPPRHIGLVRASGG